MSLKQSDAFRPTLSEKVYCWLDAAKMYYVKKPLKIILSFFLYYSGIVWLYGRYFNRKTLLVLAYHSIGNKKLRPLEMEHDPENFRQQMAYLKGNYHILSLKDFLSCQKARKFPPKSALVTFDDGFRDNYVNAFPILRALGMPAVIFIAPQFIDNHEAYYFDVIRHLIQENSGKTVDLRELGLDCYHLWSNEMYLSSVVREVTKHFKALSTVEQRRQLQVFLGAFAQDLTSFCQRRLYLSWSEVREMSRQGIDFGGHSMSHAHLASLPPEQCLEELATTKKMIEEKTGTPVLALAYPFGSRDAFNEQVEQKAEKLGFAVGFSLIYEPWADHAFTCGRKMVDSHATASLAGGFCKPLFAAELAGLV